MSKPFASGDCISGGRLMFGVLALTLDQLIRTLL